jgi:hypothetical protein
MDMIGHQRVGPEFAVPEFDCKLQLTDHELGDCVLAKVHRPTASSIEISVHPNESLAIALAGRRVEAGGETTV